MKKRIGLSLSLCIAQMIAGVVKEEAVEKIITNTVAKNDKEWDVIVADYCKRYWGKNPEEAKAIFSRLLKAGKIEQPRLNGEEPHWNENDCWL